MFRAFLRGVGRAAGFAGKGLIITIFYMKFKNRRLFLRHRLIIVMKRLFYFGLHKKPYDEKQFFRQLSIKSESVKT
ncbi:hypothetical protein HMPREF2907_05260 [Neisseria sp. HMSC055H02]|nr:hypothetical protein HMPREF2907_05260 [Neisseria sp. HMSC055H02]